MKHAGVLLAAGVLAGCVFETGVGRGELPAAPAAATWQIVTLGTPGRASVGRNGLAVDASGAVHVACRSGGTLLYACVRDGRWTTEPLDSRCGLERRTGFVPDLALDADGRPVITYGRRPLFGSRAVRCVRKTPDGKWAGETITDDGNVGRYTAVAVAGDGTVHAAWLDYKKQDDLYYGVARGGTWEMTKLDFDPNAGFYCDMAVDAAGRPHVVYATVEPGYEGIDFTTDDYVPDDLKYAVLDGGRWTIDTVDTYGNVGYRPSIRLDAAGTPHVSYAGEHRIKVAVFAHGEWKVSLVDDADDVGTSTALALDARGGAWVAYDRGRRLWVAHRSGGTWTCERVDAASEVAPDCAVAVDASGTVHVVYTDVKTGSLKYAHMKP